MSETVTSLSDLPNSANVENNIQMTTHEQPVNSISLDQLSISKIVNGLQQASLSGATRLPSRDIPMTSTHLSSDNEAMPNYVPPNTNKYINDDDYIDHFKENKQLNAMNTLYSEIQYPLILSILYFIFQMPAFKNILFQYFNFLFSSDGNYNINGLLFLSIIFSLTNYLLTNIIFK